MEDLKELRARIYELNRQGRGIDDQRRAAEKSYAEICAANAGVKRGCIIVVSKVGYTSSKRIVRRYRVERVRFSGFGGTEFNIYGTLIRKDGTDGETSQIWRDWTMES